MKKVQILALVTGVITFLLMLTMNQESKKPAAVEIVRKQVIAARADINPYTEITADMLTIIEVEEGSVHPNAIYEQEEVIGTVSTVRIFSQEPILTNKICLKENAAAGLSLQITPGKRAISIDTASETGLADNLRVGNWVDLVVTFEIEASEEQMEKYNRWATMYPELFELLTKGGGTEGENGEQQGGGGVISDMMKYTRSYLMLQDIKILALETNFSGDYNPELYANGYTTVSLEVEPIQALMIHEAKREGSIRLILREQSDHEIVDIGGVSPQDIYNELEYGPIGDTSTEEIPGVPEIPTETQGEVS